MKFCNSLFSRVADFSPESTVASCSTLALTSTVCVVGPTFKVTLMLRFSPPPRAMPDAFIDICINNAIQFPSGGNTYAPTEGKCRSARGPSPAGAGPVGHGLVAERSGASHPVRPQFRPALAPGTAPRGTRRFAGALLAGTPAEVGGEPA